MSRVYKFEEFLNERTYWTMDMLQDAADDYDTRNDFKHGNSAAYKNATAKKLMDELFKNHDNDGYSDKQRKSGYWSKERLEAEAEDCNTKEEFFIKNKDAYVAANAKKMMKDLFKNKENDGNKTDRKPKGYWTKEKLQDEVENYDTKTEFKIKNFNAYMAAANKKLLNDLFKDKPNGGGTSTKGTKFTRWTEEMIQAEADKYGTITKFREGNEPAYKSALYKKILYKLFADKPNGGRSDFGEKTEYWTEDRLKNEVENYKTRVEFYEKNRESYMIAAKKKLLDKLFANKNEKDGLTDKYREKGYWTKERLQAEVDKYDTRIDFFKYSKDAYTAAEKKKLLDKLFINKKGHGMSINVKK